jgi:predicted nucleotide-binding protein
VNEQELIQSLIDEAEALSATQEAKADALVRRTKMFARRVFGDNSPYLAELDEIHFPPQAHLGDIGMDFLYVSDWRRGQRQILNLMQTMLEELQQFESSSKTEEIPKSDIEVGKRIFVVHGHNNEMKQAVARTLERLGLEPIILHEQENAGRTIIEKLIDHAVSSAYAVVLLSPDDMAHPKGKTESARPRARQNVIFELGFFLGKLGRDRVFILHKNVPGFEIPSNYAGVAYQEYDGDDGKWRYKLVGELRKCGFDADSNRLT